MQYSDLTKEFLEYEYIQLGKDINQIGREIGLDGRGIWRYLLKFVIPRRKRGGGHKRRKSLVGRRFGKLLVISESRSPIGFVVCECLCDCGKKVLCRPNQLHCKKKSCGCAWLAAQRVRNWKGYGEVSGEYWTSLAAGAKRRGFEFSISIQFAWSLYEKQNGKCALTGLSISFSRNRKINANEQTASLDRIDVRKGYVSDNVRWVHKDINRMRQNYDDQYFIEMCRLVIKANEKK